METVRRSAQRAGCRWPRRKGASAITSPAAQQHDDRRQQQAQPSQRVAPKFAHHASSRSTCTRGKNSRAVAPSRPEVPNSMTAALAMATLQASACGQLPGF